MKNYRRWAALAGAAILTLSEPFSVLADEMVQDGTSMQNAIVVPSNEDVQTVPPPNGTETNGAEINGTGSGQTQIPQQPQQNPQTPQIPQDPQIPAGTNDTNSSAGQTPPSSQEQVPPSNTESSNTENTNTSTTKVIRSGGGNSQAKENTGNNSSSDYSLGPGFVKPSTEETPSQPEETVPPPEQQQLPTQENQLEQPNPNLGFQPVQGQTLLGVNRLEEGTLLYDVPNSIVQPMEIYTYDQMVWDLNRLQSQYGEKIHIRSIGTSWDGRNIYDCVIGNLQAPRHILIQGGIHAREYLNPMMLMQQMEMILANYDVGFFHNNPLSSMFSQIAVHFVPMTNPDGITISQLGTDGIRSQELRDKIGLCYVMDTAAGKGGDVSTYLKRWKANARGVDLNLNFDALWAAVSTTGYPSSSGFKGETPISEPETQALVNLYNNSQYPWSAVLHYHSMGNVIYWDIQGNKVQEESGQLAHLMSNVTGGYRILPSAGGGGFKDWIQLSDKPVPSVTLETGSVTCPLPLSEYHTIWNANCLTWAYLMEWVAVR